MKTCNCMNCQKRDRLTRVRLMLELEQKERSERIKRVSYKRAVTLHRLYLAFCRLFKLGTTSDA